MSYSFAALNCAGAPFETLHGNRSGEQGQMSAGSLTRQCRTRRAGACHGPTWTMDQGSTGEEAALHPTLSGAGPPLRYGLYGVARHRGKPYVPHPNPPFHLL